MAPSQKKPEDPDKALVALSQSGDLAAFEALVLRYQKKVVNLCFSHLNQYEEACDLAQEVFVQVYHSLGGFKGQSSFSTWLYRVTLNACYNQRRYLRAKGRDKARSLEGLLEKSGMDEGQSRLFDSGRPSPLQELESRERGEALRAKLETLAPEFKKAVELVDLQGFSYEEAASILAVPVNTVRSRLSRARQALKRKLKGFMP